jgi:hypothetical protein
VPAKLAIAVLASTVAAYDEQLVLHGSRTKEQPPVFHAADRPFSRDEHEARPIIGIATPQLWKTKIIANGHGYAAQGEVKGRKRIARRHVLNLPHGWKEVDLAIDTHQVPPWPVKRSGVEG